jgi:cytochrome c553
MTKFIIAVSLLVTGVAAAESSIRAGGSTPSDYVGSSSTLNQRHELNSVRYQLDNPKYYGVPRHFLKDKLTGEDRSEKEGGDNTNNNKENNAGALADASAEELHAWVSSFRPHRLYNRLETEQQKRGSS